MILLSERHTRMLNKVPHCLGDLQVRQETSISKLNKRNGWHLNDLHTCDIKASVRKLVVWVLSKVKVRLVKVGCCVFYTNE